MKQQLPELHQLCLKLKNVEFKQRLETLVQYFLGVVYGPWQDGSCLDSLDDFNYDLARLDCVTYVEVVLALVKTEPDSDLSMFITQFENLLRMIHYANGKPTYLARNHIHCLDWIENNKFILDDITRTISNNYQLAITTIDKLSWLKRQKPAQNLIEFPAAVADLLPLKESQVPYITTEDLLENYQHYVNIFPEYSVVNIVRPNWDLTEKIGTHLNISHLGFAIKEYETGATKAKNIKFYHATSEKLKVVQETLDVYMQRQQASPTIRGINVLAISPGYFHAR